MPNAAGRHASRLVSPRAHVMVGLSTLQRLPRTNVRAPKHTHFVQRADVHEPQRDMPRTARPPPKTQMREQHCVLVFDATSPGRAASRSPRPPSFDRRAQSYTEKRHGRGSRPQQRPPSPTRRRLPGSLPHTRLPWNARPRLRESRQRWIPAAVARLHVLMSHILTLVPGTSYRSPMPRIRVQTQPESLGFRP